MCIMGYISETMKIIPIINPSNETGIKQKNLQDYVDRVEPCVVERRKERMPQGNSR